MIANNELFQTCRAPTKIKALSDFITDFILFIYLFLKKSILIFIKKQRKAYLFYHFLSFLQIIL